MIKKLWPYVAICLALSFAATARTTPNCDASNPAVALLSDEQLDKPFILVGELHGNEESPAFTAALTCRLAQNGLKVLLAVEAPDNVELPINEHNGVLRFTGENDAISEDYWYLAQPFGRTTPAMVKLIQSVNEFAPVTFVDEPWPWKGKPVGNRDKWMAEKIKAEWDTGQFDRIIFHGGNYHTRFASREDKSSPAIPDYLPPEDTVTINISSASGQSWTCRGLDDCGPHETGWGGPIAKPEIRHDGLPLWTITVLVPKFTPSFPLTDTLPAN